MNILRKLVTLCDSHLVMHSFASNVLQSSVSCFSLSGWVWRKEYSDFWSDLFNSSWIKSTAGTAFLIFIAHFLQIRDESNSFCSTTKFFILSIVIRQTYFPCLCKTVFVFLIQTPKIGQRLITAFFFSALLGTAFFGVDALISQIYREAGEIDKAYFCRNKNFKSVDPFAPLG